MVLYQKSKIAAVQELFFVEDSESLERGVQ